MGSFEYFAEIRYYNHSFANDEGKKVNLLIFRYDDNET